jgi:hypothetical protein
MESEQVKWYTEKVTENMQLQLELCQQLLESGLSPEQTRLTNKIILQGTRLSLNFASLLVEVAAAVGDHE